MRRYRVAAGCLIALGLLQMTGDLIGSVEVKAVGAMTGASPAPRVFSAVRGWETYSARFFIEWNGTDGGRHSLELTPEVGARIRGPYVRRNVYGAALAYGPVLQGDERTRGMWESVTRYALCDEAPLLRELGIDPGAIAGPVRVRFEPLPGIETPDLKRVLEAPCR